MRKCVSDKSTGNVAPAVRPATRSRRQRTAFHAAVLQEEKGRRMNITLIGHSTILIDGGGKKIITDPYFGLRGNIAFRRSPPPAKSRESQLDVDLVLLSHNHWDHTDRKYFKMLSSEVPVVAPWKVQWISKLKGAKKVIGIRSWEQQQYGNIRITAVPAIHTAVTRGYVIETEGKQIYFSGDTFYGPFMKRIARQFAIDVALMPVTTYRIPQTMGERQALHAAEVLKPKVIIPIHRGIVPRSPLLRTNQSPESFEHRICAMGLQTKVIVLKDGDEWGYS